MKRSRYFIDSKHFFDHGVGLTLRLSDFQDPTTGTVRIFFPLVVRLDKIATTMKTRMQIISGFRTPEYHATLPDGVPNSAHLYGLAADVRPANGNFKRVVQLARELGIPRIKLYAPIKGKRRGWIHLGYNDIPAEYR